MGGGASKGGNSKRESLAAWGAWRDRVADFRVGCEAVNADDIPSFPDMCPDLHLPSQAPIPVRGGDFLFIGLDGAGKTSIISILACRHMRTGSLVVGPAPSTEAERVLCRTKTHIFYAVDMPGRKAYRKDWLSEEALYIEPPICIVFIVDSTDTFRFPLVKQQFLNLTRIEILDGVSILILANKQDKAGAKSADAIRAELGISRLLRNQRRMLKVLPCTVTDPEGVLEAMHWAVQMGGTNNPSSGRQSPTKPD
nr:ArlX1 [Vischeria sp. CAUP Q 202]